MSSNFDFQVPHSNPHSNSFRHPFGRFACPKPCRGVAYTRSVARSWNLLRRYLRASSRSHDGTTPISGPRPVQQLTANAGAGEEALGELSSITSQLDLANYFLHSSSEHKALRPTPSLTTLQQSQMNHCQRVPLRSSVASNCLLARRIKRQLQSRVEITPPSLHHSSSTQLPRANSKAQYLENKSGLGPLPQWKRRLRP